MCVGVWVWVWVWPRYPATPYHFWLPWLFCAGCHLPKDTWVASKLFCVVTAQACSGQDWETQPPEFKSWLCLSYTL